MTSDAKIGLLLGLVFIFIIAFAINGLPRFRSNSSELTTNMVSSPGSLGIASKERKAQEIFDWTQQVKEGPIEEVQAPIEEKENIRFKMPLPSDISVAKDTSIIETPDEIEPTAPEPVEPAQPVRIPEEEKIVARKTVSAKPSRPKFYVVTEDDRLGLVSVAQKFYGSEQGNKKVNIDRIFEANKKLLKSPDQIFVGQKLTIPPLVKSEARTKETGRTFAGSILEKVKSIGQNLSNRPEKKEKSVPYIVQEDDNLWQIAAEQLGNGSRYKEISKLNANILKDENDLTVGMLIRMPTR